MFVMNSAIINGIIFVIYMGLMIGVGAFFYKRSESHSDYILGGRGMNVWVTAMSAQASDMSGWLLMGLPGLAYASAIGASEAVWTAIGLAIGTYLNWLIVAKPLRQYTQKCGDSLTIPDFLHNRFRMKNSTLRIISALFILIFFTFYTASGFVSGANLFNQVFGISYQTALLISVFVVVLYTFLGGFKAVCWTDLIQGIMMFIALIIVPLSLFRALSGTGMEWESFKSINLIPDGTANTFGIMGIIGAIAWGVGYFGQPHILARFMAIRSAKEIKPARIIAIIWVVITLIAGVVLGIIARPYLQMQQGIVLQTTAEQQKVFMILVQSMFPTVVAGILLSAILAAIMSTADSQLLVAAGSVSSDFYKPFINKKASDKELVWVSRMTVIAIAIIAGILALDPESSVFAIVSYAWAGFGSAFGPIILCSLFWKRTNGKGALAGVIGGGLVSLLWKYAGTILAWFGVQTMPKIFSLYEIVPGFIISLALIIIVSLLTEKPSEQIQAEFDEVKLMKD